MATQPPPPSPLSDLPLGDLEGQGPTPRVLEEGADRAPHRPPNALCTRVSQGGTHLRWVGGEP